MAVRPSFFSTCRLTSIHPTFPTMASRDGGRGDDEGKPSVCILRLCAAASVYVRERQVVGLEFAILFHDEPAGGGIGLNGRGAIREGAVSQTLVIFDAALSLRMLRPTPIRITSPKACPS